MSSPLHIVVSHASVVLLCGVVVGRRSGTTVAAVGSTLTLRDTREQLRAMLSTPELATFDDAYGWDKLSDAARDVPIFVAHNVAHPTVAPTTHAGKPLVLGADSAELVGVAAPRRSYH